MDSEDGDSNPELYICLIFQAYLSGIYARRRAFLCLKKVLI